MKTEELKKIIRMVVQEELKKQLPVLIPQVLSEALTGKKPTTPIYNPPKVAETTKVSNSTPKKQYDNPILNEIFNNTVVKIKPDNKPFVGYSESLSSEISDNDSINYAELNESVVTPNTSNTPVISNIQPENEEQAKVLNKINRDFRGLMKAVDAKRKGGMYNSSGVGME